MFWNEKALLWSDSLSTLIITLSMAKKSCIWDLSGSFSINHAYLCLLSHIQLNWGCFIWAILPCIHTFYCHLNAIFSSQIIWVFVTLTHGTSLSRHCRVAIWARKCTVIIYFAYIHSIFFLPTLLNVNKQNASWCNATQHTALVVACWMLHASCICGHLIATYPICLNWSLSIIDHKTYTYDATCHTFAIFVMHKNSNPAFVGRHDKPHFCCFHDTAWFLSKKCMNYVNRHH